MWDFCCKRQNGNVCFINSILLFGISVPKKKINFVINSENSLSICLRNVWIYWFFILFFSLFDIDIDIDIDIEIEVEVESKEIKCCLYIEIIIKRKKEKG